MGEMLEDLRAFFRKNSLERYQRNGHQLLSEGMGDDTT